jgi:ABC-2 type transport system permease protein
MAGVAAPSRAEPIRPEAPPPALRHLLWLKWTLTRRGLARDRQRLIGAILFLLLIVPIALVMGVATFLLYRGLPRPAAGEFLYLVLTLLFVGWVVAPLFLYNLNESLDVSRLFLYPIAAPRLMTGLLAASLLDLPVLFLLAFFAAILAAWINSPAAAVIAPLALLLLYAQMVAAGQTLLTLFNSVLRSRRFRDISFVVLAIFGSTFFLWQQLALRQLGARGFRIRQLLTLQISPWLEWTPPGMVAQAIRAANGGDWAGALVHLGLSALVLAALAVAWHRALAVLMTSAETGVARGRADDAPAARAAWWTPPLPLPRPILALAGKDLRYFWRDPQIKAMILNTVLALSILIVAPWVGLRAPLDIGQSNWLVLGLPLPVILTTLGLAFNAFGMERGGLRVLFLLPISPTRLLLGKNLAVLAVAALETIILGGVLAAISDGWSMLPVGVSATLAAVLVTLGVGNAVAVMLPGRMPEGMRATYSADSGCARGLLQFGGFLLVWTLIAPVGAAIGLPTAFNQPALHLIGLPLAIGYAVALYVLSLRLVAPLLQARQPEILAITTRD